MVEVCFDHVLKVIYLRFDYEALIIIFAASNEEFVTDIQIQ